MVREFQKNLVSLTGNDNRSFLLTVSGGIDSVVMSHLFSTCGLKFAIAHCNFQLRGDESDGDQVFVEKLARQFNAPIHVIKFDTRSYAAEKKISIQMAARDLRYEWFEKLASAHGYDLIATGHNRNDVVETMLLNLARGTGIRGLMGIRPLHNRIIRPLLFASRKQISEYAAENNLQWRDDSSNTETKYHRNKIRHDIIPAFEEINPAFMDNVLNTTARLEQTGIILDMILNQIRQEVWKDLPDRILIDIEKLKDYPSGELLLFELLKDFGVSKLNQESLMHSLESESGKQFHTPTHTITRDREHLIITAKDSFNGSEVNIEKNTVLIDYPVRLHFKTIEISEGFSIPGERSMAALDADKLTYPLLLRTWKEGDRFRPLGLKGSKKVSDFLINIKLPVPDKKHVWILESAGEIVWLVNLRIDERFKVSEKTQRVLMIDYRE
jgi:tRNA(Ile)-lysidine synthase